MQLKNLQLDQILLFCTYFVRQRNEAVPRGTHLFYIYFLFMRTIEFLAQPLQVHWMPLTRRHVVVRLPGPALRLERDLFLQSNIPAAQLARLRLLRAGGAERGRPAVDDHGVAVLVEGGVQGRRVAVLKGVLEGGNFAMNKRSRGRE